MAACCTGAGESTNKGWGIFWGFVSGGFAGIGDLCFYLALQSGADAAVAIPLISLYPVVTLAVAYFGFRERLGKTQSVGLVLAVVAITVLSGGAKILADPLVVLQLRPSSSTIYPLIALIFAGLFTAAQELSTQYVTAEMSFLSWCAAFVVISLCIIALRPLNWNMPLSQFGAALAAGALNGFGVIASFAAYRNGGKAAIVAPLTATVQPLVTVLLAVAMLGEIIDAPQACGILLAVVAAAALSIETRKPPL